MQPKVILRNNESVKAIYSYSSDGSKKPEIIMARLSSTRTKEACTPFFDYLQIDEVLKITSQTDMPD
jgi:hypothetical protein